MAEVRPFEYLCERADCKGMVILIRRIGKGHREFLRIEAVHGAKVIDFEKVRKSESIEDAARRMEIRMRKDRVID